MTDTNRLGATRVIIGVDTHRDEHVAVAIDCLGAWLGQRRLPSDSSGYEALHCWASGLGDVVSLRSSVASNDMLLVRSTPS